VNATKERQAWCCFQVKLCDPCLSALYVPWCEKALYKYSSFPFLSDSQLYSLQWRTFGHMRGFMSQKLPKLGLNNCNTPCLKNVPLLSCYNFDTRERILIFFGRNVTGKVRNQKTLYFATSNNLCFCTTWQNGKHENFIFHSLY